MEVKQDSQYLRRSSVLGWQLIGSRKSWDKCWSLGPPAGLLLWDARSWSTLDATSRCTTHLQGLWGAGVEVLVLPGWSCLLSWRRQQAAHTLLEQVADK
eukprot:1159663-Pelagomonas_calceolata.AAC.8